MVSRITGIGSEKSTGKPMRMRFPERRGLLVNPALDSSVPGRTLRLKKGEGRGLGLFTDGRDQRAGRGTRDAFPVCAWCVLDVSGRSVGM